MIQVKTEVKLKQAKTDKPIMEEWFLSESLILLSEQFHQLLDRFVLLKDLFKDVEREFYHPLNFCENEYIRPYCQELAIVVASISDQMNTCGGWYSYINIANVCYTQINDILGRLPMDLSPQVFNAMMRKMKTIGFGPDLKKACKHLKILERFVNKLHFIEKNNINEEDLEDTVSDITNHTHPFWYSFTYDLDMVSKMLDAIKIHFNQIERDKTPIGYFKGAARALSSFVSHSEREKLNLEAVKNGNIEFLKAMWTYPDKTIWINLVLPTIKHSKSIYIDNSFGGFTRCKLLYDKDFPFKVIGKSKPSLIELPEELVELPILIHIHGGGFISGSPESYESYSRRWAIDSKALTVSIDYTLSPEARFPIALEECYEIYKFILSGGLGIRPTKIVFGGDSAGGNLSLTLALKCIIENDPLPDGLMLVYPALDISKTVNSSRMMFALDSLVPYYFLLVCLESYTNEGDSSNPLCSPLSASDELLSQLRKINICIVNAGCDPLFDDGVAFSSRLSSLEIPHTYLIYDFLPHGFLNMGAILHDQTPIEDISRKLKEMFSPEDFEEQEDAKQPSNKSIDFQTPSFYI